MKQIDWRKVAAANLCKEFTVAVHIRFNNLCDKFEDKNSSAVCDTLTTANRDIALELLLTFASSEMVTGAREEVKNAVQTHQSSDLFSVKQSNAKPNLTILSSTTLDSLPIHTGPLTMEEDQKFQKKLRNIETLDPDNIPAIIRKSRLFDKHLDLCNETYEENKPTVFSKSSIIPFQKKGDLQLPQKYRGITLSPLPITKMVSAKTDQH